MAVLIPDDFFELDDQGEGAAKAAPLFNHLRIMQTVPQEISHSTYLDEGPEPCPKNKGLFLYNPSNKKSMTLPCRSRTCPACGKGWGWNWRNRLNWNEFFHWNDDKALTLTSAYDPGYKKFWLALNDFWRRLRNYSHVRPQLVDKKTGEIRPKLYLKQAPSGLKKWLPLKTKKLLPRGEVFKIVRPYKDTQFFGVVEYNQKHTQPHFHFVLRSGYIPQKIIKKCWEKAQLAAGFEQIAFDVRIEQIKTSVKQYFFKYITKQADGKDELPRPEQWSGRGVRYSRRFFAARAPEMVAAIQLAKQQEHDDYSKFHSLHSKIVPIAEQMLDVERFHAEVLEVVNQAWNPIKDASKAGVPEILEYSLQFVPFNSELLRTGPPVEREGVKGEVECIPIRCEAPLTPDPKKEQSRAVGGFWHKNPNPKVWGFVPVFQKGYDSLYIVVDKVALYRI